MIKLVFKITTCLWSWDPAYVKMIKDELNATNIYIYISGWIFQKVLAEIVQKDFISSRKALISNRRNLGLFAPTSMRFPSKDSKSKDLSF